LRGSRSLILRVSKGYLIQLCCSHSRFYKPVPTTDTTPHRPCIVRQDAVQGRVSCIVRVRSIVQCSGVDEEPDTHTHTHDEIEHKNRGVTAIMVYPDDDELMTSAAPPLHGVAVD
jgi:hypothetical protein